MLYALGDEFAMTSRAKWAKCWAACKEAKGD